jgi:hypothetical protein
MQRVTTLSLSALLVFAGFATACSTGDQEGQQRQRTPGKSYQLPVEESALPTIELNETSLDDEGLQLADCAPTDDRCNENVALWDMLKLTKTKLQEYIATGHNVFAAGIAITRRTGTTRTRCVYVEIQERSGGKKIRVESLVPATQAPECKVGYGTGLSTATLGAAMKVGGNNYAAGVGIGAVYYDGSVAAGCAVGAVGYATQSYGTYGTVGGFCTEILAVP